MTTYNSYETAKIANSEYAIFEYQGNFGTDKEILDMFDIQSREMKECNPADHCMTVEKFLADGHKFVEGDIYLDADGSVRIIGDDCSVRAANFKGGCDYLLYILRDAALEKIPTETPEEKEVLDSIESVGDVEWVNGDECVISNDNDRYYIYDVHKKHVGNVGIVCSVFKTTNGTEIAAVQGDNGGCVCWRVDMLKKPETPKQREDRERLKAAYDLYESAQHEIDCIGYDSFELFKKSEVQVNFWLAIVDKTNYRKQD